MAIGFPSGTVIFLFTDMEDSTRRWNKPAAMGGALARHGALLLQAVSVNRGAEYTKGGDGMAVMFGQAGDAMATASRRDGRRDGAMADHAAHADGHAHPGGRRTRR